MSSLIYFTRRLKEGQYKANKRFYPCPFMNVEVVASFIVQVFKGFRPIPVKIWRHQKVRRKVDLVSETTKVQ